MAILPGLQSAILAGLAFVASSAAPPPERSVQDWAEQERIVSRVESRYTGPWRNDRFPVAIEIMDACSPHDPSEIIAIRGSAQTIKSEVAKNTIGSVIQDRPRGILVILPSNDEVTKYERTKLDPMLRATDALARRVYNRDGANKRATVKLKEFRDGFIQLTAAGTSKGLQMITVGLVVAEEVSEYPADTGGRGFALDQAIERGTQYEGELKVVVPSTPGNVGACKITELFNAGDQRWIFWKCPHCSDHFRFRFAHMAEHEGRAVCFAPCCGSLIEHSDKRRMNAAARFVPTFESLNPDNQVPWAAGPDGKPNTDVIPAADFAAALARDCEGRDKSFHIWRGQSPFSSWAGVWKKWIESKDDPLKLKVFSQQYLGEPFEESIEVPDSDKLFDMRGGAPRVTTSPVRRGQIPPWAAFTTQSADLQGDRAEVATYAWGPGMGACIDTDIIHHPPLSDKCWSEIRHYFAREWESNHLRPQIAVRHLVDTGGHDTQKAYRFILANPHVIGVKGMTGPKARFEPLIQPSRKGGRIKGGEGRILQRVPLTLLNTHLLKKTIFFGLHNAITAFDTGEITPGFHLFAHDELDRHHFVQLTNEHLKVDLLKDIEKWEKIGPNEQLDLGVYAYAGAVMFGFTRMDDTDWNALFEREAIDPMMVDMGPLERMMHEAPEVPDLPAPRPGKEPDWVTRLKKLNSQAGDS